MIKSGLRDAQYRRITNSDALAQTAPASMKMRYVGLEHFPAKWEAVRRRKCDHYKIT